MNTVKIEADDDHATILQAFKAELHNPAEPLSVLVRFKVKEADGENVEAAFARARSLTLSEPGCRAYDLNRDPRDATKFVVYEHWRSLADLEAHFRKDYFSALRAEFNELIIGAPEFQILLPTA
jgi:quinol monooxygenase YgiN